MNQWYVPSILLLFLLPLFCQATDKDLVPQERTDNAYGAQSDDASPTTVYWGDAHVHTNLSLDAYIAGNTKLGPEAAYRFARGDAVMAHNGMTAKLKRPLDFLVVADHAFNMGLLPSLASKQPAALDSPLAQQFLAKLNDMQRAAEVDRNQAVALGTDLIMDGITLGQVLSDQQQQSVWDRAIGLADHYNDPGRFTAFIGYEWTQIFYRLHRVVIFKDDASKVGQVQPFSQFDSSDPEALWAYLNAYETQTGGQVMAIPHNSNSSQGVMFALEGADGKALSVDYAKTRSRWEPLLEVTQFKGDSEAHPVLSPQDPFADFETMAVEQLHNPDSEDYKKRFGLTDYDGWIEKKIAAADPSWNYRYSYARPALKLGLQQQARLGVNPFKFGLIGSTDSHTSLATADNDNFFGSFSGTEPYPNRVRGTWHGPGVAVDPASKGFYKRAWHLGAAGYAAVWAQENTRDSLFAAMQRKEVYASTGPRIKVRFFAGWDYQADDAQRPDLARIGYAKGVPMGGDLTQAPPKQSPQFLIRAVKDPDGANLDRVQVVKGWHDQNGELHEKVYNVALSDQRKPNRRGEVKPVGNTVNIAEASYSNSIGDPELAVVWQDPDFNPNELAFYYVRVLEIPTPRWTAYDANVFGLKNLPDEIPMVTQERAYTSPIWYTPEAGP